jgi:hypothetical protein
MRRENGESFPEIALSHADMTMKKAKHTPSKKAGAPAEERDETLADRLVELALDLRESDVYTILPDALRKTQADLRKVIKKCLQSQREQALDEALERSFEEDAKAYRVLRENVEELSGTILFRRNEGPDLEVNAFVVPLFVRTMGGLRSEQCFQDEEAFEQLRDSFQEGGLESRKASVVLVSHAYHLDEIERIGYCHLNEMVREAFNAMTRKKTTMADAIARSMRGWPPSHFAPDDNAMELRFLLGFALRHRAEITCTILLAVAGALRGCTPLAVLVLRRGVRPLGGPPHIASRYDRQIAQLIPARRLKTMDDPFYYVPEEETAADRYFEARAERFRKWSQQVVPLLQRCLVTDRRDVQINFLYQDLFHGAQEAARGELEQAII